MGTLIIILLAFLFLFSFFLPKKAGPTTFGSAKFSNKSSELKWMNKGFLVTKKALDASTSCQHLLLMGGTGSGKSQRHLIKQIFHLARKGKTSLIVLDPKMEIKELTEGYCIHKGLKTYTLNLMQPEFSHSYNCLEDVEDNDIEDVVARMYEITNELANQQDSIWSYGSKSLISLIIKILKKYDNGYYLNLSNVFHVMQMLQVYPQKVTDWMQSYAPDEQSKLEAKRFTAQESKIRDGQLSGAVSVISAMLPEVVKKISNTTTIPSLSDIRKESSIIYICLPIGKDEVFRPIISLYLSSLMNEIVNTNLSKGDLPIAMILEEFAQLVKVPNYSSILAVIRSRRCMLYHCIQAVEQLYDRYGQFAAETILANNNSYIIMPGLKSLKSQEFVKQSLLGKSTITRKANSSDYENHSARFLMTNDEIRKLDKEKAIFVCGNEDPVLISPKPLYKDWWLKFLYGLEKRSGSLMCKHPVYPYVNSHQATSFVPFQDHESPDRIKSFQERLEALLPKNDND
jgi:type IV secretion system protein VirD4